MVLILVNLTGTSKSYLSNVVTVAANSSTNIISNVNKLALATDGQLYSDIFSGVVEISDGVNQFGTSDAKNYLNNIMFDIVPMGDGVGNPTGSIYSAGINNLAMAIGATNYILSTANTTTTQLAANATFTGAIENIFNQPSYSVLLTSDQPGTLILNQYIDAAGTFLAQTLSFSITANQGFARSGPLNGNYFNVVFKNTGSVITTTLNINAAYGTIPSSTQLNNSPSSINEVSGSSISLGQKTSASSFPVVLPSDQVVSIQNSNPASLNAQVVGNIANLSLDSGNPVKVGAVYNSTLPIPSSGNRVDQQVNQFGELATQFRNKYKNIVGNATTTVKSGSGRLHGIMVNRNWTGGTVIIYDNTAGSGTVIATIDFGSPTGGLLTTTGIPSPTMIGPLGLEFSTGLTAVTSGNSSNNITILYQ